MANETLRAALQEAGLTPDDLAQIVEVDVRTVRRWLSGQTPYPRQRGKVARALDITEHTLWPEIATTPTPSARRSQPSDLVAAYPTASDLGAPDWKALMHEASDRIELLGDTLTPILATPGVPELLATKAVHACEVRILVSDPGRHLAPLLDQPGIELRVLEVPAQQTIHRFDNQLLLILHLLDQDAAQAPLLHLKRAAPKGLFERFAEYYNQLWEDAAQPIDPDHDLCNDQDHYDDGDEQTPPDPDAPDVALPQAEAVNDPSAPSPRRWPRRPT